MTEDKSEPHCAVPVRRSRGKSALERAHRGRRYAIAADAEMTARLRSLKRFCLHLPPPACRWPAPTVAQDYLWCSDATVSPAGGARKTFR